MNRFSPRFRALVLGGALVTFGAMAACSSPTNPRFPQPDEDREPGDDDRGDEQGMVVPGTGGVQLTFLA